MINLKEKLSKITADEWTIIIFGIELYPTGGTVSSKIYLTLVSGSDFPKSIFAIPDKSVITLNKNSMANSPA